MDMRISHKAEKCKDGLIDLFCGVEGQTPLSMSFHEVSTFNLNLERKYKKVKQNTYPL